MIWTRRIHDVIVGKRLPQLLLVLMVCILPWCGGCLAWPVKVVVRLNDEQTAQGVIPKQLTHRAITLSDGRATPMAGLRTDGLPPRHMRTLDERIVLSAHKRTPVCLIQPALDGRAYVVVTNQEWYRDRQFYMWPLFPLIPIPYYEWHHPLRQDMALTYVRQGLAQAAPEQLVGVVPLPMEHDTPAMTLPQLQQAYRDAEATARTEQLGIFRTPERELYDEATGYRPDVQTASELLAQGVSPTAIVHDPRAFFRDTTPLLEAAKRGHLTLLKQMLPLVAKPDYSSLLVQATATQQGYRRELYRFLLDNGAAIPIGRNATQFLYAVCWEKDIELVNLTLNAGADPNSKNQDGDLPLNVAVDLEAMDVVQRLLQAGANPNATDGRGKTALKTRRHKRYDNEPLERLLKEYGARN